MNDVNEDKRLLRRLIAQRKKAVGPEQRCAEAQTVFEQIEGSSVFRNAKRVLLYHSLPDELPTHEVIERWNSLKEVYLPRVKGNEIEIVRYNGQFSIDNRYHISEPVGEATDQEMDLAIVPAVAVDPQCFRLGRGGGFYDRWMAQHPQCPTWAVALNCQLVERVPTLPHDLRLDGVITALHTFFTTTEMNNDL